jgi:putative redox protein
MFMGSVSLKWIGSTLMVGSDSRGQTLVMGKWPEQDPQWNGMKPSDLLLLAAASCSSWDVVTILTKQRQPLESLEVICTGNQLEEPPYNFTAIHLKYCFKGDIDPVKAEKAIKLSQDKYCSVINTFNETVNVTCELEVQSG